MNERTYIIAPAMKLKGGSILMVPAPLRHSDILSNAFADEISLVDSVHGFITNETNFVTRKEAYQIAEGAGQIINRPDVTSTPGTLYTEDLY